MAAGAGTIYKITAMQVNKTVQHDGTSRLAWWKTSQCRELLHRSPRNKCGHHVLTHTPPPVNPPCPAQRRQLLHRQHQARVGSNGVKHCKLGVGGHGAGHQVHHLLRATGVRQRTVKGQVAENLSVSGLVEGGMVRDTRSTISCGPLVYDSVRQ